MEINDLTRDWKTEKYSAIIDYIINTHHVYLHRIMPELSELVTKIFRVHGPSHDNLKELHKYFHTLKMDLEQHLIMEEEELFPLIKAYEVQPSRELSAKITSLINGLEEEHSTTGDILKDMRRVTDNYFIPEDICKTYAYTFTELEKMESDLFEHIHLENNILFPRLQQEQS